MKDALDMDIPGPKGGPARFRRPTHEEWNHFRWLMLARKFQRHSEALEQAEDEASIQREAARLEAVCRAMGAYVLPALAKTVDPDSGIDVEAAFAELDEHSRPEALLVAATIFAAFVVPPELEGNSCASSSPRNCAGKGAPVASTCWEPTAGCSVPQATSSLSGEAA